MNKTDMSNPARCSRLSASFYCTKEGDKQRHADGEEEKKKTERSTEWKWGRGEKETYPGQDRQGCGQLRQSRGALNCRGTVNH